MIMQLEVKFVKESFSGSSVQDSRLNSQGTEPKLCAVHEENLK